MSKSALWEAIKEPLRILVIALIPLLINWLSGQPWNTEFITLTVIVLRAIDKILHDYGKEAGNTTLEGGLTRF
jgi:hypothetical protein